MMSLCAATSSSDWGRYFSLHGTSAVSAAPFTTGTACALSMSPPLMAGSADQAAQARWRGPRCLMEAGSITGALRSVVALPGSYQENLRV